MRHEISLESESHPVDIFIVSEHTVKVLFWADL